MASASSPLIVILGPTGSGKSDLALDIACTLDGEIVNCDSLQVYRFFDIGTAKVPQAERRGIPHHLIDIVDPDQSFTAGDFARLARPLLDAITSRGKVPVLAGGTGFYLRALLDGLFPGPTGDATLRDRLQARERRRPGSLHRLLGRLDARAASLIHANDVKKTIRALEVRLLTGSAMTGHQERQGRDPLQGYRILKIGLSPPREMLYQHLNQRCEAMFAGGLLDEVRGILERGFAPTCKPFESHGYKQALQHIEGRLTLEAALDQARQNTRRYAKRQWTWYSRESGVQWFRTFGAESPTREEALAQARGFLQARENF